MGRFLEAAAVACSLLASWGSAWTKDDVVASRTPMNLGGGKFVPGKYIIEIDSDATAYRRDLAARASTLVSEIETLGYTVDLQTDYSSISDRFSGVSVQINNDNAATLEELYSLAGVSGAWPVETITLGVTFNITEDPSPAWNPHVVTRVKELHDRGLTGSGQRVCIVDSGVDVDHPALSGKIAGGKNLVNGTTSLEDCVGHGTFVSSVIVGDTKDFTGVAPDAEIYMYKVFPCSSSTSNDLVLEGLLAADADDCDIISMSLGSDTGYAGSVMSRVASAVSQDRLVIIAAGNAGEEGVFYGSSPASGRGVIAVASSDSNQVLGWQATIESSSGESLEISYVTSDGQKLNESVTATLKFDPGDACNPTLSGSEEEAIVVKRGVCTEAGSYKSIVDTGFGYCVIFDSYNQGVFYQSDVVDWDSTVHLFALTEASVGNWTKIQAEAGYDLILSIKADANSSAFLSDLPNSGQMSYYTSWGPSFENDFYPSITAPGGYVYGALPDNQYAIESGTSFSTPYISGVAALFYAHRKKDPSEFARRLISTAVLLPSFDETENVVLSDMAPLAQQGAGLVDAVKTLDYETVIVSGHLISLNDTDNRVNSHTITIRNDGSGSVTYQISHITASTVQSRDDSWYPEVYFPPLLSETGSITAPDSITLGPGNSADVQVTFNPPENVDSDAGVLWSGKVVFEGSNDEVVSVSYMGVEVSTYNWTPLEEAPLVYRYDDDNGYLYPVNWESQAYKPAELDSPEIYFALRYGTYEYSIDIVGADWTAADFEYPPVAEQGSAAWYGSLQSQPDVYGSYTIFPSQFLVRFSGVSFVRFQCFANGTDIPSGKYRVLNRALRMFGDASNPDDWQLYVSDPFYVQLGYDTIPGFSTSLAPSTTASYSMSTESALTTTSEQLTTSQPATTSQTSVPGITTTLTAIATPTGLSDAFVDISLHRLETTSTNIYEPNAWLELHVEIFIPTRVVEGSVLTFGLPLEFGEVALKEYASDLSSNLVATTGFDNTTGLYSITFNTDWVEWHSNITGDFYLACRFKPEFQEIMDAGTYFVEIPTVSELFQPPVYYRAVNRSTVYEHIYTEDTEDDTAYIFDIEVPGSLGPWKSVTVAAAHSEGDGFLCDDTYVAIGTDFDTNNQVTSSKDITQQSIKRCEVKSFKAVYNNSIATEEVLQFKVANILGFDDSSTISMTYSLSIELDDGSTTGLSSRTLTYRKSTTSRPDGFFNAVVDRTGPIEGGTSTSAISTATTATLTSMTTEWSSTATASASATSSNTACATGTNQAISLTAFVGNSSAGHAFYLYSNFLAVDLEETQTALEWQFTDNGTHLQTSIDEATVFASVHSNSNSLVYLYTSTQISSPWSYLECSVDTDGHLSCVSGDKHYFYICDTDQGLVRHGTEVHDGCKALTIAVDYVEDTACAATTTAGARVATSTNDNVSSAVTTTEVPSTTSAEVSNTEISATTTTATQECSGTAQPVSLEGIIGNSTVANAFYLYSDFLALDLTGNQTDLEWTYLNNSLLATVDETGATRLASVHSNSNSLVYMYETSRIKSPWSYLQCTEDDGVLHCSSELKRNLYVCESTDGLLRSGPEIASGCTTVTVKMQRQCSSTPMTTNAIPSATERTLPSTETQSTDLSAIIPGSVTSTKVFTSTETRMSSETTPSTGVSNGSRSTSITDTTTEFRSSKSETFSNSFTESTSIMARSTSDQSLSSGLTTRASSNPVQSSTEASSSHRTLSIGPSVPIVRTSTLGHGTSTTGIASYVVTSSGTLPASSSASHPISSSPAVGTESIVLPSYTTSTVFATQVFTVTSCSSTVQNCPASAQYTTVTTQIVAVSTTICPLSASTIELPIQSITSNRTQQFPQTKVQFSTPSKSGAIARPSASVWNGDAASRISVPTFHSETQNQTKQPQTIGGSLPIIAASSALTPTITISPLIEHYQGSTVASMTTEASTPTTGGEASHTTASTTAPTNIMGVSLGRKTISLPSILRSTAIAALLILF